MDYQILHSAILFNCTFTHSSLLKIVNLRSNFSRAGLFNFQLHNPFSESWYRPIERFNDRFTNKFEATLTFQFTSADSNCFKKHISHILSNLKNAP